MATDAGRKLFGTDGVRGEAGTFLTAELATLLGRAATASLQKERPQVLIVSHSVFQGPYKGHGVQNAQAIKMVLAERGWRAGPYSVGMQACEEADAKTGVPSPEKCARNARAFARNRDVLGVIGPLTSNCAVHMLAPLNKAPDGPLGRREDLGRLDRLEHVVERPCAERAQCVLVVRRHEHRERHLLHADHVHDLQPGQSRHLDIEEHEIR